MKVTIWELESWNLKILYSLGKIDEAVKQEVFDVTEDIFSILQGDNWNEKAKELYYWTNK